MTFKVFNLGLLMNNLELFVSRHSKVVLIDGGSYAQCGITPKERGISPSMCFNSISFLDLAGGKVREDEVSQDIKRCLDAVRDVYKTLFATEKLSYAQVWGCFLIAPENVSSNPAVDPKKTQEEFQKLLASKGYLSASTGLSIGIKM